MGLNSYLYKSGIADTFFSLPYPLVGISYDWGCFRGKLYEELFRYLTSDEYSLYTEEEDSDWVKHVADLMRKNFDKYIKNPEKREEMLSKIPLPFDDDKENRLRHVESLIVLFELAAKEGCRYRGSY